MTISELIKKLQKLNPEGDLEVYYPSNDDVDFRQIRGAYSDTVWQESDIGEYEEEVIIVR